MLEKFIYLVYLLGYLQSTVHLEHLQLICSKNV